jgi:hypothetical protein
MPDLVLNVVVDHPRLCFPVTLKPGAPVLDVYEKLKWLGVILDPPNQYSFHRLTAPLQCPGSDAEAFSEFFTRYHEQAPKVLKPADKLSGAFDPASIDEECVQMVMLCASGGHLLSALTAPMIQSILHSHHSGSLRRFSPPYSFPLH